MFRPTGCYMTWIIIRSNFLICCYRRINYWIMNRSMLVVKINTWFLMRILDICSKVIIGWLILIEISLERIHLVVWNNAGSSKWSHVVGNLVVVWDKSLSLIKCIHMDSLRAYWWSNHTFWFAFFSHYTSMRVRLIIDNPLYQSFHDLFNSVCNLGLALIMPLTNIK